MMRVLLICLTLAATVASASAQTRVERWSLVPDLRIGSVNAPDYSLTEVLDLEIGSEGEIYVLQWGEQTIHVFDRAGKFLRVIGRRGEGPGEFFSLAQLGWKGDTLWVQDPLANRVSLFHPSGKFLTSISFTASLKSDRFLSVPPGALLANGSLVSKPGTSAQLVAEGVVKRVPLVRLSRTGEVIDTLVLLSVGNTTLMIRDPATPRRVSFGFQPLSDESLWEVAPDGSSIVVVERPAAERKGPAFFRVTKLDAQGDTLLSRRYSYTPRPLTEEVVDRVTNEWVDEKMSMSNPPSSRAAAERLFRTALYRPAYHSPVTKLVMGRDGTIWLRREDVGDDRVVWNVLDKRGNVVAVLITRQKLRLFQADRDQIWGVENDELDVPYVVRYRIVQDKRSR